MHVDRSSVIDTAWAMGSLFIIAIGAEFEGSVRMAIQGGGFALLLSGVFVQTFIFQVITQSYPYFRAYLVPSKKVLHLFAKSMKSSRTTELNWATEIELAFPVKHEYYGKLKKVIFHHRYPREKRFNFDHGTCVYLGYSVDHPQVEHVTLYEYPRGSYDLDHVDPVPTFYVREASNDYFLNLPGMHNPGTHMLIEVQHQLNEKTREAIDYKEKFIREEERSKHFQNQLAGMMKGESDFDATVTERMLAIRRVQLRIENALKHRGKFIGVTAAVVLIFGMVIGSLILVFNPHGVVTNFGQWLQANTMLAGIFGALACLTVYYLIARRK